MDDLFAEAERVLKRLDSSDPDFDDCADAAALIHRLVAECRGPAGFATWKDAALDERMKRVADQPSTVPDNLAERLSSEERDHDQTMKERDDAEKIADALAHAIAAITGDEIGEHSNMNCPWQNALDAAEGYLARAATPPAPECQHRSASIAGTPGDLQISCSDCGIVLRGATGAANKSTAVTSPAKGG